MTSTTGEVPTFVDTSILAYAHDGSDQLRQPVAAQLIEDLWRSRDGVRSTQVLTEFYAVVTRKFAPPLPRREARSLVDAYAAWPIVPVDPPLIVAASALEEQHSLSFWDALIIEAARRAGADRLVSEDLQHRRRIGLVIENPFAVNS
ncbi:MAG: PIN domain-containing protein [Haloechinothrix sp.]